VQTRAKYLPSDERRAETVEAVVTLAGVQNPSDITTAAIAGHMNLTQGALFRHFPNKDSIWKAVMEWAASKLLARIDKAAAGSGSPRAALQAMFMSNIDFICEHPGVPRMMFGELQRAEITPAKRMAQVMLGRYRERLARLVRAGQECGELRCSLDPDSAATLFIGMIQGLVVQSLLAGDVDLLRRTAPRTYDIFLFGLMTHDSETRGRNQTGDGAGHERNPNHGERQ
jgi:TetR/AcrR family transcriptional regulator